jgi:hypothetical protein
MFTYNNIRKHVAIKLKTTQNAWNEYFCSFQSDRQPEAAKSEGLSRLVDPKSVMHFNFGKSENHAIFDYMLSNKII